MGKKLSPTAEQTRQNIMDSFWTLYEQGGMEKATVTKICCLAGYNRSTFYTYFQDSYAVLDAIEAEIVVPDNFMNVIVSAFTSESKRKDSLLLLLNFFDQNSKYFTVLLGEHGDPAFRHKVLKRIAPKLFDAISSSSPEMRHLQYKLEYQNAAVVFTITKWYQNGKDIPKDELLALLYDLTINGVRTELNKHR